MDTTTEPLNVRDVAKGDKLIRAAHRHPSGCENPACGHQACDVPEETFQVTGKRRAPKGERVYIRHPHGWGCAVVADADGNLKAGWRKGA